MTGEYKAVFDTGTVITSENKHDIYKSIREYFSTQDAFLAVLSYNGTVIAYVWDTPAGMYVVSAIGEYKVN